MCGFCGDEFKIADTDPHWPGGRGPSCPAERGLRHAIRTWSRFIDAAMINHPASDVQVELEHVGIVPYGGSVAVMFMRRILDGRMESLDEDIDGVIEAVIATCWGA